MYLSSHFLKLNLSKQHLFKENFIHQFQESLIEQTGVHNFYAFPAQASLTALLLENTLQLGVGVLYPSPLFLEPPPPRLFKRKFLNTSLSEHFEILAHRILFKINWSQLQIVSMLFVALTHSYQLRKRVRCCSIHFHPRKNLARYRISPIRKKILPQQKDSPQMISTFDQFISIRFRFYYRNFKHYL